jgi:hypothetical protein
MSRKNWFITLIGITFAPAISFAQPAPPPRIVVGGGGPGGGGGGFGGGMRMVAGGGNSAQFRQQTLDAIKDQLAATDDEWEKIQPKIEKLLDAKRLLVTGAGLNWSSQNGGPMVYRVSEGKVDTPAGKAMQEIRDLVSDKDKDVDPEELNKKMAALQAALDDAKAQISAAQKDLKASLTPKQLGIMATMGYVE